jgi:hypothetical protein
VIADHTPGPHRTDSDDIFWWLPVIGPTARRRGVHLRPSHTWSRVVLANGESGPHGRSGRQPFQAVISLERLHRFGVTTFVSTDTLTVRLRLPAPSDRQLARLPEAMAVAYRCPTHSEGS